MGKRGRLMLLMVFGIPVCVNAQNTDYQLVDSITNARYLSGDFTEVIKLGNEAIAAGNDFPALRLRIGYACYMLGNYSAALQSYNRVLSDDSRNQTALYYAFLCNSNLNRTSEAGFMLRHLDTREIQGILYKPFAAIQAGIEAGFKFTDIGSRGNSTYTRAYMINRLGYILSLEQSLSYFNQSIFDDRNTQVEYYGKLSFVPVNNLMLKVAYHFTNSAYRLNTYANSQVFFGVKYNFPYLSAQADASFGAVNAVKTNQYNATLTYYPLGNLNVYGITRASLLRAAGKEKQIYSQALGIKIMNKTWLEGMGTTGNLASYTEADNLYLYNAVDATTFKTSLTGYFLLRPKLVLNLNYSYEQKSENIKLTHYNQHSITSGLTWKF